MPPPLWEKFEAITSCGIDGNTVLKNTQHAVRELKKKNLAPETGGNLSKMDSRDGDFFVPRERIEEVCLENKKRHHTGFSLIWE
jgi:hypothetical protein